MYNISYAYFQIKEKYNNIICYCSVEKQKNLVCRIVISTYDKTNLFFYAL